MTMLRCLAILAMAVGMAFAQPLKADIPFAFGAANQTFEPGDWRVDVDVLSKSLRFTDRDKGTSFHVLGLIGWRNTRADGEYTCYLTFKKYGDRYFLASVVRADVTSTMQMSRAERELVTSRVVAERRPVTVIVAARLK